jgi:hypothetical protein
MLLRHLKKECEKCNIVLNLLLPNCDDMLVFVSPSAGLIQ